MKATRPRPKRLSRRDFLKVGGTGLAGAALLGTPGCGGGQQQSGGPIELVFTSSVDQTGTAPRLVERFNEQNKGKYKVIDRKSTRLNSSHANISYAVFCLKKKKRTKLSNQDKPVTS